MKHFAIVITLAAGCGSGSGSEKSDPSKMPAEDACRSISTRMSACRAEIGTALIAAVKSVGASEVQVERVTPRLTLSPCDHADADVLAQLTACYDDDCVKLAQCFGGVVQRMLMPKRGAPASP